jgi:tetratricopeptide (TPR) repeat protein
MNPPCEQRVSGARGPRVRAGGARCAIRRGFVAAITVCVAVGGFVSGAVAQNSGGWNVEGDDSRRGKVVQRYKELLEKDPSKGVIFDKLVEYVGKDEGVDRLIEQYSEKADNQPDEVNYKLILGHLHKVRNDDEKALEYYDRAVELAPERPAVWMSRGEAHQNLRNRDQATEDFEKALEQVDRKARKQKLLRKLADIAFEQQDWKRAERYYDRLLELDPRNEYLRQEYAQVLVKHRRYEKALEQYEELLNLAGRNTKSRATTLRDMGDLYEKMGKDKKAVETYREAMGLVRSDNWLRDAVRKRVIGVYRSNDRLGDLLEQYEEKWPSPNYEQSLLLGRLSEDVGEDKKALEYLDRAARVRSGATEPRERKIVFSAAAAKTKRSSRNTRS